MPRQSTSRNQRPRRRTNLVSFQIPHELIRRLDREAARRDLDRSKLIRLAIRETLSS